MTGPFLAAAQAGDGRTTVQLGRTVAATPRLALRWLRGQAVRIANGLDPEPGTPWIPPYVLRPAPAPLPRTCACTPYPITPYPAPDAPTDLRAWAADDELQAEALHRLATGTGISFVARDEVCWYGLTARPLLTPRPAPAPVPTPAPAPAPAPAPTLRASMAA
ncbi:hypothetical protein ACFYXM_27510 [Streptomyces sp. NPDC002476]|uniref:hypothetical protein n=1 Tax=Streptomyces sp. NPDC002476 TaxID=3364648 RepID=UPI0036825E7F